jgi:4-hydroxybenzoate polyprenyltransferase
MPFVDLAYSILASVLAGTEVVVLFASTIGLLGFAVRQVVRAINGLLDMAIDSASPSTKPRLRSPSPSNVLVASRVRRIPGGHNETF